MIFPANMVTIKSRIAIATHRLHIPLASLGAPSIM